MKSDRKTFRENGIQGLMESGGAIFSENKENESFNLAVYESSLTYTQNLFGGYETTHQVEQQESKTTSAAYSEQD